MHEILDTYEEVNLDDFEYCTLVEDTKHFSQKFPMYIPKLMAGFPIAPKAKWVEPVSKCYVNAPECDISFQKKVDIQNFVTVQRHFDTNFVYRADEKDIVKKGVRFIIQSMYGNPKDIKVVRVV